MKQSITQQVVEELGKIPFLNKEMPVYAKASGEISNGQLTFDVSSVKIGRLPVSAVIVNNRKQEIINYYNKRVNGVPGLKIHSASVLSRKYIDKVV